MEYHSIAQCMGSCKEVLGCPFDRTPSRQHWCDSEKNWAVRLARDRVTPSSALHSDIFGFFPLPFVIPCTYKAVRSVDFDLIIMTSLFYDAVWTMKFSACVKLLATKDRTTCWEFEFWMLRIPTLITWGQNMPMVSHLTWYTGTWGEEICQRYFHI